EEPRGLPPSELLFFGGCSHVSTNKCALVPTFFFCERNLILPRLDKIDRVPVVILRVKEPSVKNRPSRGDSNSKEHFMSSKLQGILAAALVSSAVAFAGASGAAAQTPAGNTDAATQAPIVPGLGKTSTPNRVARRSRATHARVESKEQQITRQLNQAAVSGMNTAQATIPQAGPPTVNETGAQVPVPPAPA